MSYVMLPIGGGQFLIYEEEEPTPTAVESVPDTFTLGRFGKKRRHRVEV